MANSILTEASLNSAGAFNWIFLISFIVVGILGLFFLFYFNRLFATVVSYAVRLYTWHAYRIYVDVEALQISLLAGRIFFKGIRYHGDNLTVFVHGGHITWRYWLLRVKDTAAFRNHYEGVSGEQNLHDSTEPSGAASNKKSPCRIAVEFSGLEVFLYNNGLAYDNIVNGVKKKGPNPTGDAQTSFAQHVEKSGYSEVVQDNISPVETPPEQSSYRETEDGDGTEKSTNVSGYVAQQTSNLLRTTTSIDKKSSSAFPSYLRILPVYVKCTTGGFVLGNEHTKSVITVKFDSAEGELDADRSGPLDIFKLITSFDITHPIVHMRPNSDFKGDQLSEAENLKAESGNTGDDGTRKRDVGGVLKKSNGFFERHTLNPFSSFRFGRRGSHGSIAAKARKQASGGYLPANRFDLPGQGRWLGLSRYLDENLQDEHDEWNAVEYAKSSTLADVSSVHLAFIMDMPGIVQQSAFTDDPSTSPRPDDINGSTPPEYTLDLAVQGGQITYGPWADRHRINLQQIFFPTPYTDVMPTEALKVGETRIATYFKLNLAVEGDTTLRIPFRESSKDWRWKGRAPVASVGHPRPAHEHKPFVKHRKKAKHKSHRPAGQPTDIRPFGWFDVTVKSGSSVKYLMSMVAGPKGFNNKLAVDVNSLSVASSLNHDVLLRSQVVELRSDLSNPLAWNGLRSWPFDIAITKLDCFLLRDHTFMIVDLIADWGAGPPPEFFTFAPFRYLLGIKVTDLQLYLNTNDANIVNNPDDLEDNNFVILQSRDIKADLVIPLDRFRPSQSEIIFDVIAHDLAFQLRMPPINTISVLLVEKEVARLDVLLLHGIYSACSEIIPGLTDTLNMDIAGSNLTLDLYGFVARQLIRIKENYFGDDIHFRTMEEYREAAAEGNIANFQPPAKANDLDVILNITAQAVNIVIPAGLYDTDEHVTAHVDVADVDLRVTNYYLEMMVNASPLELSYSRKYGPDLARQTSGIQVVLDGAKVFGHRLFGLPPAEPPYVDDWEIDAGSLLGECSTEFIGILIRAAQAIALSISDNENAMSVPPTVVWHQATFVQFQCPLVRLGCLVGEAAFLVSIEDVHGTFSDWAGSLFSQKLKMAVPKLSLACCDRAAVSLHKAPTGQSIEPYAQVETSLSFNMVQRNANFDDERMLQQEHIKAQDVRASRSQFLLRSHTRVQQSADAMAADGGNVLSIPVPSFPQPVYADVSKFNSMGQQRTLNGSDQRNTMTDNISIASCSSSRSGASIAGSISRNVHAHSPLRFEITSPEAAEGKSASDWRPVVLGDSTGHCLDDPMATTFQSKLVTDTLKSPFKLPYFPLSHAKFNGAELPTLPTSAPQIHKIESVNPSLAALHNDTVHTSLIIAVEPGLVGYVQPEAVRALASLLKSFDPMTPGAILDNFHMTTIGEVLAKYTRKHGKSSVLEINANVPHLHLRFINPLGSVDDSPAGAETDRYACVASNIGCMVRIAASPRNKIGKDTMSLHGKMSSLSLSAKQGTSAPHDDGAALRFTIDDVLVWLLDGDRTTVQASFRKTEAVLASSKVDYLASLIHRTTMLADDFALRFASIGPKQEARLRYVIYKLTTIGAKTRDPSFLTRPSQALRSAKDHLRNNDSWKIISKYHYIYQNLTTEQRMGLFDDCAAERLQCPDTAEAQVFEILEEWRSWDALPLKDSFAMRILYGTSEGIEQLHDRSGIPVDVTIRAGDLSLVIDPGEKQSQFSLDGLAICLSITPAPPPTQLLAFDRYTEIKETVLQINTNRLDLQLAWEICELVDQVLTMFEKSGLPLADQTGLTSPTSDLETVNERYHIIFASGFSTIQVKTLNVTLVLSGDGLQFSIEGKGWAPQDLITSVNVVVSATNGSAEIIGNDKLILRSTVKQPAIWLDYERESGTDGIFDLVRIVGDSKEIDFDVQEDILGVLELVTKVLNLEGKYFQHLVDKHELNRQRPVPVPVLVPIPSVEETKVTLNITVALFLDVYKFGFKLLPGVRYSATGKTARISISPTAGTDTMKINFDIKSQTYRVIYGRSSDSKVASIFHLPPINGALRLKNDPNVIDMEAILIVEQISLDGRAIYELLSIVGHKAVAEGLDAIRTQSLELKKNIELQFPQPAPIKHSDDQKTFVFDVNAVLAGFSISADMPSTGTATKPATLNFNLSSTQIRVSNRTPEPGTALAFPNIRVAFNEIRAEVLQLTEGKAIPCGRFILGANFRCVVTTETQSQTKRDFALTITGPFVDIYAETAPTIAELMVHLRSRIDNLDLSMEKKYIKKLRSLQSKDTIAAASPDMVEKIPDPNMDVDEAGQFLSTFAFDMQKTQVTYIVEDYIDGPLPPQSEDLVFTIKRIHLMTRSEAIARLGVQDLQLQFVSRGKSKSHRSSNSALLPEVIVNVTHASTRAGRKIVVQAAGKALDISLNPHFILPASDFERSISSSSDRLRIAAAALNRSPSVDASISTTTTSVPASGLFGTIKVSSLKVTADFSGAIVRLQGLKDSDMKKRTMAALHLNRISGHGRYGQFDSDDTSSTAILTAPGIAVKVQYLEAKLEDASLNVEVRISGSNNVLYPAVVPLVLQVADSIKEVMNRPKNESPTPFEPTVEDTKLEKPADEVSLVTSDPRTILGKTKLDFGFRICKQEISFSCHPIAKVAASASLDDIYVTVNTVDSNENGNFLAASIAFRGLEASLKHVYSREPTFKVDIESIVLSIMNSKHIGGTPGISAILKLNPTNVKINAKQSQELLLFREIWMPPEIRHAHKEFTAPPAAAASDEPQEYFVQRYRQVAAQTAFPWNASVVVSDLNIDLDLGQTIGKTSFRVSNFWISSKKSSNSKQTLCVGIDDMGMNSTGRMSGFVKLQHFKIRSSIAWPKGKEDSQTPLVQGSIGFKRLRVKAAFDYTAFAVVDITAFEYIMYNVHNEGKTSSDRLVAILDGDAVNIYCTAASGALGVSLYQAFERLVQEKEANYEQALREIERFLRRKSIAPTVRSDVDDSVKKPVEDEAKESKTPLSLHTDVVVTLRSLDIGALPSTLLDAQVFRAEASDVQARFAVTTDEDSRNHSGLGLTLGQVRMSLATVPHATVPKTLGETTIEDVVNNAKSARGGVILRVPRVVAMMQTWEQRDSRNIEYLFKSVFEGKIDVGWNYSRISFIRGMWATHTRTLASRLGKPLPESAVKISGGGVKSMSDGDADQQTQQEKITAVVNLPQSKYTYTALEPPIIDTPQLRDMGEATPPLEWVGLNRDKLPNVTHQIVIVTLLEIAREVEDVYTHVLGVHGHRARKHAQ